VRRTYSPVLSMADNSFHFIIGGVTKAHPTSISPQPYLIAVYVLAIYAGQIGHCLLLVLARKAETKASPTAH